MGGPSAQEISRSTLVSTPMSSDTSLFIKEATEGYRALRESAAWFDATGRGNIRMLGEDRKRLLHAMSTNHIEQLEPGQGCYAFFLNAQGRILADVNVLARPDFLLLDTEPELAQVIYRHLDGYIIADDVTLEDRTAETAVIAIGGPKASEVLEKLGAPLPAEPYACADWENGLIARIDLCGTGGFLILFPASAKADLQDRLAGLGVPEATAAEARTVRIEQGKARYGEEITDKYLVQETGQIQAMHFTKGCYLGQEIVERVRSRGQVHRHLKALAIDSDTPPSPGAKLTATAEQEGADAGEIVSAAWSPAMGKTVAMAYLRTPFADPGAALLVESAAATVRETNKGERKQG